MIEGLIVKDLTVITDGRGLLMEMLRSDDPDFQRFGQVYITMVRPGVVKAWHYHKKQTDYFVCVGGTARVALYDSRDESSTKGEILDFEIGWQRQRLIIIPPGVCHGFMAVGAEPAYIVNVPTEPYDYENPDEYRRPYNDSQIGYDWGVENA